MVKDGALFSFGRVHGALGHSDTASQQWPKRVVALANESVVGVATGDYHSLVLTAEGALFSFGHGLFAPLGHGDTANQLQPKRVVALAKERVVGVATGFSHSLVLTAEGALFSFGYGAYGQLGHGDTTYQLQPKRVETLAHERVVGVAADSSHALASADGGGRTIQLRMWCEWSTRPWRQGEPVSADHGDAVNQWQPNRGRVVHQSRGAGPRGVHRQ